MSKLKNRTRGFTAVYNDIINDERISLKAKGLYLFLLSKPDNWTFSARLISTQNNDQKASINSALHELENFGLLVRVPCQGGYDYDLFDKIKVTLPKIGKVKKHSHFTENQQSTLPKIHSVENRQSISNKEFKANREERENNFNPPSPAFDVVSLDDHLELICGCNSDYPLINEFIDYISKGSKHPLAYRSAVRYSLLRDDSHQHNRTYLAYVDFEKNRPDLKNSIDLFELYENGFNVFDIIGRD